MINQQLLESVDSLETKNHHSMVLYKNPQYGTMVINRFIENGLKKGEHVVFITHEDASLAEKQISSTGIDVDYYKKKKLLYVYQIEDLMKDKEGIPAAFEKLLKKLSTEVKPPCRFVGRSIKDISTDEGMKAELVIENLFHSQFDKYDCSFLCTYPVYDIEKSKRPKWLTRLIASHHNFVFAAEPAKSVIFDPDLLNSI